MGRFLPFFPLTSSFFGLTLNYKIPLLNEVFYLTQTAKGFNYSDVMNMPTWERRYYLSILNKRNEEVTQQQQKATTTKGRRTTSIGGDQLKSQMMNGNIPLT